MFWAKGVLRNFAKFTGKHPSQACNCIKKETVAQVFSLEFCKIFKKTFTTERLGATASQQIDVIFYISGTSEERDMRKKQDAEWKLYMNVVLVIGNLATNVPQVRLSILRTISKRQHIEHNKWNRNTVHSNEVYSILQTYH